MTVTFRLRAATPLALFGLFVFAGSLANGCKSDAPKGSSEGGRGGSTGGATANGGATTTTGGDAGAAGAPGSAGSLGSAGSPGSAGSGEAGDGSGGSEGGAGGEATAPGGSDAGGRVGAGGTDTSASGGTNAGGGAHGGSTSAQGTAPAPLVPAPLPGLGQAEVAAASGVASLDVSGCELSSDGFVSCTFTDATLRVVVNAKNTRSWLDAGATCELLASLATPSATFLGRGYSGWLASDGAYAAAGEVCFSAQVFVSDALDLAQSQAIASALAESSF